MKKSILMLCVAGVILFAAAAQAEVLFYENFSDVAAASARFGFGNGASVTAAGLTIVTPSGGGGASINAGQLVDNGTRAVNYSINEREMAELGLANILQYYFRYDTTSYEGANNAYTIWHYWDGGNELFGMRKMINGAMQEMLPGEINTIPVIATPFIDWNIKVTNTATSVDMVVTANGTVIATISDTAADRILTGNTSYFEFTNNGYPSPTGVHIQEIKVETVTGSIAGTINLSDYIGDRTLTPVRVDFLTPGTSVVVKSASLVLDESGVYQIDKVEPGTYDIAFSAAKWLRKLASAEVVAETVTPVSVDLLNGDIDGDNEVTSTDLSILGLNLGIVGD